MQPPERLYLVVSPSSPRPSGKRPTVAKRAYTETVTTVDGVAVVDLWTKEEEAQREVERRNRERQGAAQDWTVVRYVAEPGPEPVLEAVGED